MVDTYVLPNKTLQKLRALVESGALDPLRDLSEACREELSLLSSQALQFEYRCTIWVTPTFETLGMYLLIVFCVHGLAAWVAFGSERISYMGLQIALAFDLGVLMDYAPATEIDPIRDRFIGIVLGILIISTVFSLVWPEDSSSIARQKLAASLRAIARLLNIRGHG